MLPREKSECILRKVREGGRWYLVKGALRWNSVPVFFPREPLDRSLLKPWTPQNLKNNNSIIKSPRRKERKNHRPTATTAQQHPFPPFSPPPPPPSPPSPTSSPPPPLPLSRLERDVRLTYLVVRVIKLVLFSLFCSHVAACIFYYLATTIPAQYPRDTWIGSLVLGSNVYEQFRSLDVGKLYVTALYWATMTMGTIGGGGWREGVGKGGSGCCYMDLGDWNQAWASSGSRVLDIVGMNCFESVNGIQLIGITKQEWEIKRKESCISILT